MKIYVDYDDCLCETAKVLAVIAARLFGKHVPYEEICSFDLQRSFKLTDTEYEQLIMEGHRPEVILSYEETPGASQVLNEWIDKGHEVFIITGRPYSVYDASRRWLDYHGLERAGLFFLNKYNRTSFIKDSDFNLEPEEYYRMKFDVAIEDSPFAFKFFDHLPNLQVCVFDRPWNKEYELRNANYSRCADWAQIREIVRNCRDRMVSNE